ncbi:hypothetical protein CWS43_21280 [Rahnella sp. AA]|uniref:hypothetical protein n=1 Tax=Rahnella sp. AA TaxID=2057180 RepID=UPI000C32B9B2|nr:hypothetical protein [Rahnella sp. AA]PKE28565.1 hypothetical protein CWS43_21280 [Rahnella sp. AA]
MTEDDIAAFRERMETVVYSLKIAPQVAENQVIDRVALSFRKLLNFFAENTEMTQQILLSPPHARETQSLLSALIAGNLAFSQQNALFRDDISATLMGQCFTGIIVQLACEPGDPALRHQNSQACAKLFCEGIWSGKL